MSYSDWWARTRNARVRSVQFGKGLTLIGERTTTMKIRMKNDHTEIAEVIGNGQNYIMPWKRELPRSGTTKYYHSEAWEPVPEPVGEWKPRMKIRKKNDHAVVKEVEAALSVEMPWRSVSRCDGTHIYYSSEVWELVPRKMWQTHPSGLNNPCAGISTSMTIWNLAHTEVVSYYAPEGMRFRETGGGSFMIEEEVPV